MSTELRELPWKVLQHSVRGASHERSGLPNQDAVGATLTTPAGLPAILVVSDGHGSAKCLRSDVGSKIAVTVALEVLQEFISSEGTLAEHRAAAEDLVPRKIVLRWRELVLAHFTENPLAPNALEGLNESDSKAVERAIARNEPYLLYGATLVCIAQSQTALICWQLGDGQILVISEGTCRVSDPLGSDDQLIANETTSLCQDNAWNLFRFRFQPTIALPALILLTTDGYPNSFESPEGFKQVASDLLNLLDRDGADAVDAQIPGWLLEASKSGSGDDVSIAILYGMPERRLPAVVQAAEMTPASSGPTPEAAVATPEAHTNPLQFGSIRRLYQTYPSIGIISTLVAAALLLQQAIALYFQKACKQ